LFRKGSSGNNRDNADRFTEISLLLWETDKGFLQIRLSADHRAVSWLYNKNILLALEDGSGWIFDVCLSNDSLFLSIPISVSR